MELRPDNIPKLEKYVPSRLMLPTSHYDEKKANRAVMFIENLKHTKGIWAGKPFWLFPWQEQIIRDLFGIVDENGIRQFRTAYIEIPKKNGKELSLDTPIPTPEGFTSMGDLRVGDTVFDEKGRQCHVVAKSEVDDTEQVYRLTFRDGTSIIAGERHLWNCEYIYGKTKSVLWTTGEIYKRTVKFREAHKNNPVEASRSIVRIPVASPLQIEDIDLPVDPYLFGYWLGNGNALKPEITVRDEDIDDIISLVPYKLHCRYRQKCGGSDVLNYSELKPILLKSFRDKKIRPEYLRASESQRWSLLQGLMDSDGCIEDRKGQSIYVSTIKGLADTVRELLWSLGIKNAVTEVPSTRCGKPTGETLYKIRFTTFEDQPVSRLPRKIQRCRKRIGQTRSNFHYLSSIEPIDHPVKMQCIQVDSESHQYLAGPSMVPTHNSDLAAAVALYLLYADGELSPEVYGAAADRPQASIVYDIAKQMVEMSPALMKRSKVLGTTKRIVNYTNAGFYQVLSSESNSKHGFNISGLVFDELHAQPNRKLYDVLTQGSGDAREQPLYFLITTAGTDRESICYELHQKAVDILDDRKVDPSFYPVIYGLRDDEDWTDEKNWYKANPSLGLTVKIDRVRAMFNDAISNPSEENNFKQLRLNMWVSSLTRFIPDNIYKKGDDPIDFEALKGRECYAGLDLSSTDDITCLVLMFPPRTPEERYIMVPYFWLPEDTIMIRVRRASVPYDRWVKQGYIAATPGNVIAYGYIEECIQSLGEIYQIKDIAFDRWGAVQLTQDLEDAGFDVVAFGQGFASMSPPTKEFYRLLMQGSIQHGGNPVLSWMAGNVVVDTDPAGNIKCTKADSLEKIDGIVAAIMALDRCIRSNGGSKSVYDDPEHDLMVF